MSFLLMRETCQSVGDGGRFPWLSADVVNDLIVTETVSDMLHTQSNVIPVLISVAAYYNIGHSTFAILSETSVVSVH